MNKPLTPYLLSGLLLSALLPHAANAALVIPSDGSDGDLIITRNEVIDLSDVTPTVWNAKSTARRGGVYDAGKWAVVYKFNNVNIASGAVVTFKNHPSRAPVVWLVKGSATINGTVNLSGQDSQSPPTLAEPGPGGFRGGTGYYSAGVDAGPGFGIGGGTVSRGPNANGAPEYSTGGTYGGQGTRTERMLIYGDVAQNLYGNPSLLPLLGGSGGGGFGHPAYGWGGGAGGGAILVAVANELRIGGEILANGGSDGPSRVGSSSGSGGGIRIVAESLTGDGRLRALPGVASRGNQPSGSIGRIRIERAVNDNTISVQPDTSPITLNRDAAPLIWPPANAPEVRIVSIGSTNAPPEPRAEFGTLGADVVLPRVNQAEILVETRHALEDSEVYVRLSPRADGEVVVKAATKVRVVDPVEQVILWSAIVPVKDGYAAVQARVIQR